MTALPQYFDEYTVRTVLYRVVEALFIDILQWLKIKLVLTFHDAFKTVKDTNHENAIPTFDHDKYLIIVTIAIFDLMEISVHGIRMYYMLKIIV